MGGLYNKLPNGLDSVDVVIAGGGTAGCVVAARLSDAYPTLSILVVEGGQDNRENPAIRNPILFFGNILPESKVAHHYETCEEPALGRKLPVPTGGVLGGGSSINLLTYSRPQRIDLNAWGTPGWSADDLIPYFKKLETYHGPGTAETHGKNGPVHVTDGAYSCSKSEEDFLQAAARVGYAEVNDIQNFDNDGGMQRNLKYVGKDGKRQDAAHAYLHPRLDDGEHVGLHVLVEHEVIRVLFDGTRAVGVEVQPNTRFQATAASTKVMARKMVVLSCGSLGTPLLLERSGVGSREVLRKAGVPIVADVPGVGRNYMDHHLVGAPYRSSLEPGDTLDAVYGGRCDLGALMAANDPIVGWNAADITSKVRPTESDVEKMSASMQDAWRRDFRDQPSKPMAILTSYNVYPGDPSTLPPSQYFAVTSFTTYPYSRGHIHITGAGKNDAIDFETGILSDENGVDVKMLAWAYKKQREIVRRMDCYRGEYAPGHPPFPETSTARLHVLDAPLADVSDIHYSAADDAILEEWIKRNVGTTWHSMGTCKLGSLEDDGVVNGNLSVYGVQGLKVADLSVAPNNVAANTGSTAFMIGEKAADLFVTELSVP